VLRSVDLLDTANKQVMKLSSGMHQRLGIARALIKQPSVLLLDEPTRSLDLAAGAQLWNLIAAISGDGITIMLATHNFEEAAALCGRVGLLRRGELLDGVRARALNSRQLRDFYLEMAGEPNPRALSMEVPA
jgi:ABC-2 type transport system ATP-binding protein